MLLRISQYDDDTLNDTEEVGKVLVTNVTCYYVYLISSNAQSIL